MQNTQTFLQTIISQAIEELGLPSVEKINLEHPANPAHGEWSCNVAMQVFGKIGKGENRKMGELENGKMGSREGGKSGSQEGGELESGKMGSQDVRKSESMDSLKELLEKSIGQEIGELENGRIGNREAGKSGAQENGKSGSQVGNDSDIQTSRPPVSYKSPRDLAQSIVDELYRQLTSNPKSLISKIEVAGPGFINFYLSDVFYVTEIGSIVQRRGKVSSDKNNGKTAIVEFSSPNIAKPFTVGHLRSTIIGHSVANLLEATGFQVLLDNHLGDWGTQFGKQIYAIKTWGDEQEIENADRPVKKLVELYVKFHEEAEKDPSIEDQGREWFKKLEDGDPEARRLWQKCIDWSWVEFQKIYDQLNVSFSPELNNGRGLGESFFEDKMDVVLDELEMKPELYKVGDNGAKLFFFPEDKLPPLMILKKDGATLYATRDLATDKYRKEAFDPDLIVNEVGAEQALYFRQIYEIEKILGWYQDGQRVHVKHGLYRFKDKKMSTRKGNVIWLEDVLAEAVNRAMEMGKGKIGRLENGKSETYNLQPTAYNHEVIGIGALKWNDLRRSSELDIVFDWDEILNMEGNSGPYMQYSYVRAKSIWKKFEALAGKDLEKWQELLLSFQLLGYQINPEEQAVLVSLARFSEAVERAADQFAPHHVCTYLYELAQNFNSFYNKHQVLGKLENGKIGEQEVHATGLAGGKSGGQDFTEETMLRLKITQATMMVIEEGLRLLGIEVVEEM